MHLGNPRLQKQQRQQKTQSQRPQHRHLAGTLHERDGAHQGTDLSGCSPSLYDSNTLPQADCCFLWDDEEDEDEYNDEEDCLLARLRT